MNSPLWGQRRERLGRSPPQGFSSAPMTPEDSRTETGEVLLARFDLLEGTSESTRAKTAETFLELLGARVRNPNTRSAYRVAWSSFLAFCSARRLELESVKAYHVGSWLDHALREKPINCNPPRHGPDRRAMRGACQRNASKMARKLPHNRGP
jgi:hypothetical protein